jgi:sterol 14-demethylase
MTATRPTPAIPRLGGGLPGVGHLLQLKRDPIDLMRRVAAECGEIGEFRIGGKAVVLMSGERAQEAFFRAPDEQLDQAAAYPFMKPIFGEGVVFDAPAEQRSAALGNTALRDTQMRGHAETITAEVDRMVAGWGDAGEIDLLDFFAELMIYTSSACLIGRPFREDLGPRFAELYYALERGTDAVAYMNPYLPLPSFRRRDRAREEMVGLVTAIMDKRRAEPAESRAARDTDLLDILISLTEDDGTPTYTPSEITGMSIAMMFAGHHTTSGTAAWTLIELLRNPDVLAEVVAELDELFADGRDVSYQALREIPLLEASIKEALRLHPPLILLMRLVTEDLRYGEWTIPAGKLVGASPALSNRLPGAFPDPDRFDIGRYDPPRAEDRQLFAWIPFGAGRHRCVGAAFAMIQLKAVLSSLLLHHRFEMTQPPDTYRNDHSRMVVQLQQPCVVRHRRRAPTAPRTPTPTAAAEGPVAERPAPSGGVRVEVDLDLCQAHSVCCTEAPGVFQLGPDRKVRILAPEPGPERLAAVRQAVRHCPTGALHLHEPEPTDPPDPPEDDH